MISLEEVRKKLPEDSLKLFEQIFDPAIFNKILLSFRQKRKTTFRVNTLKGEKSEIINELKKLGFKFQNILYIPGAFQLDNEENNKLLKSESVIQGKIYLQSISSLMPVLILEPQQNEKILDIAASPGSKTSQIAALMNNTGSIDAVEPDFIRMEKLKHNLNLLGVKNVNCFQMDGNDFCKDKKNIYDRVLADVPCSGEGRFSIYDKSSYGKWKLNNIERLSNLQKKLLKNAILATKIGGIIVYSTCTLNYFENEKVIDSILKDNDFKVEILPISEKFKNIPESITPFFKINDQILDKTIKNCLRIIPSSNIEGFFICKMKRIK